MVRRMLVTTLAMLFTVASAPTWAIFESNKELVEQARISMEEAIITAQQTIPGQPVHVKMGKDAGHTVYQIEILDKNKKSRWVYVDATNGAVTETKR
jgi:uncharacterized membrane protein YkoI